MNAQSEQAHGYREQGDQVLGKKISHEQAILHVGAIGIFQWMVFACSLAIYIIEGFALYIMHFLTALPKTLCTNADGLQVSCDLAEACALGRDHFEIDYSDPYTLKNWAVEWDLICEPRWKLAVFYSSYFFGCLIGLATTSSLGDTYGRILTLQIGFSTIVISFLLITFVQLPVFIVYFLIFTMGFAYCMRAGSAFLYIIEVTTQQYGNSMHIVFQALAVAAQFMGAFYFSTISNDWKPLFSVISVIQLLFYLPILTFPESPRYYLHKNQTEKAINAYDQIAKINGRPLLSDALKNLKQDSSHLYEYEDETTQEAAKPDSQGDSFYQTLLKTQGLPKLFILINIIWSSSIFCYYLITYYTKYIPGNMYTITAFHGITSCVFVSFTGFVIKFIGIKYTNISSFTVAIHGALGLLIFGRTISPVCSLILAVVAKNGVEAVQIVTFLLVPEYAPPLHRTAMFGACNLFSRGMTMFSSQIAELQAPLPLMTFIGLCIFGLLCQIILPQKRDADDNWQPMKDNSL